MPDHNPNKDPNPFGVRVGDVYQSNDIREAPTRQNPRAKYQPIPFKILEIDGPFARAGGGRDGTGRPRTIRMNRLKPTTTKGYKRLVQGPEPAPEPEVQQEVGEQNESIYRNRPVRRPGR